MGLPLVAAGVMAGGQIYSGLAAKAEGDALASQSMYNAQVKQREIEAEEQRGRLESIRQAEASAREIGVLENILGSAGAVTSEGTPVAVLGTQASEFEKENLLIGFESQTKQRQLASEKAGYEYEAKMHKKRGKAARTAGFLKGGSTLLTGFA